VQNEPAGQGRNVVADQSVGQKYPAAAAHVEQKLMVTLKGEVAGTVAE
jgi:hypothetical protein